VTEWFGKFGQNYVKRSRSQLGQSSTMAPRQVLSDFVRSDMEKTSDYDWGYKD